MQISMSVIMATKTKHIKSQSYIPIIPEYFSAVPGIANSNLMDVEYYR